VIPRSLRERFGRLPTGFKMLIILNLALLPLGIIALLASLQASRNADNQRRADVRIALSESTRKFNIELASDVAAMRVAANAIAFGASPQETCARLATLFSAHTKPSTPFALFGVASAPVCTTGRLNIVRPSTVALDLGPRAVLQQETLDVIVPSQSGSAVTIARYPVVTLHRFVHPAHMEDAAVTLSDAASTLPIMQYAEDQVTDFETATGPVGVLGLSLTLSAPAAPFGIVEGLLVFLPLLMWAAASIITFLLVNRLLILPLRELRAAMDSHKAGAPLASLSARTPAREIRELGADIANALDNQAKATREVHHRVKNNLQIIASLISLHARSATAPDAAMAYAAIQRRVDALAIVHRNHYAELDTGGGIDLRRLIGEVAANLRANPDPGTTAPPVSLVAAATTVSQDTAIAIAFLMTELVELAAASDAHAPVSITLDALPDQGTRARISIMSESLRSTPEFEARLAARYARIIEGLGRQLRAPIERNNQTGRFSVEFAALAERPVIE
jgi:two-component system, sensor histidine kinase PdtaS